MSSKEHKPLGMMADWPNDDLCLEQTTLKHLQDTFPRIAPIFDASDLHGLFREHEGPANRAKKLARRWGKIAIGLGFAGLCLAALFSISSHIFPSQKDALSPVLAVLVCLTTVSSVLIGYRATLRGKTKHVWMENRLWTERIRQFHFQLISNNIQLVQEAVETQNFDAWKTLREKAISRFSNFTMKSPSETLAKVLEDEGEAESWLNSEWKSRPIVKGRKLDKDLLAVWQEQRLGVQLRYTRLILTGTTENKGVGKRQQVETIQKLMGCLTIGALIVSFILAVIYLQGQADIYIIIAQALLAIIGGASIALRAFEEGMNFTAERDRMEWYLASLEGIHSRFGFAKTAREHVELMRELERLSYQEMHRFFMTMNRAKFII